MSNGSHGAELFGRVMRSKAALDAAHSYKRYKELLDAGWDSDKAFLVAFMGVHLLEIPGLKPVPEPDPPFELASLRSAVKDARGHVARLLDSIDQDLKLLAEKPE